MTNAEDNITQEPSMKPNGHPSTPLAPPSTAGTPLQSFPGPVAKGHQTTITLFSRAQLIASGLLPPLANLINASFNSQSSRKIGILQSHNRLRDDGQLLDELGHAPDTFVYVIRTADSGELIGTAYASRYEGVSEWPEGPGVERTWARLGVVPEGMEAWELHMMAVHPEWQRQGLAGYLMGLVDGEIKRREEGREERLVLFISTIQQTNEGFYAARGFEVAYAVEWPEGHMGSQRGFTVVHMDRAIKVKGDGT